MKTMFELERFDGKLVVDKDYRISIGGMKSNNGPYVMITIKMENFSIQDKDLERFAVNILKALKSKKLK